MLIGCLESCRKDPAPPVLDFQRPDWLDRAPALSCVSNSSVPTSEEPENPLAERTRQGLCRTAAASSSDPSTPWGAARYVQSEDDDLIRVRARPRPSPFGLFAPTDTHSALSGLFISPNRARGL